MGKKIGDWFHYAGAIHVHTTESDGTKKLEEVAAIGERADLDFILFTDHMNLHNREQGKEGFYGRLLALVGYEHNDVDDNNHYMIFESPSVYPSEMTSAEYVSAGAKDNALGIIAHPDEIRDRMGQYPPYPWTDWNVDGYTGIELWNQMSEWMERLTPSNKLLMAFSPRKSMVGPTDRVFAKWDEVNRSRKIVGVASVDAHAFPITVGPLKVEIFPYKVHFRSLRTYVILPEPMSTDFATAKNQVYGALRDCRAFGAHIRWGDPIGFQFSGRNGSERVIAGGRLSSLTDAKLEVRLPSSAVIRLVGNGKRLVETTGDSLEFCPTEAGIYRVEAWKNERCWIFSNHIRIGV
ncbi:MAG: histidinol-phosphatase [bacterium]|nr:histidinol-phosphatase [bacterium]